jgi:hypothetical protein
MRLMSKFICLLACTASLGAVSAAAQTIIPATSPGNTGAGPNSIAVTPTQLLFTQPFAAGDQTRGIYKENLATGTSSLLFTIPEGGPAENALVISPGLGGFTAGDTYVTGVSTTNSANGEIFKNGSTKFVDAIFPNSRDHMGLAFDSAGTFGFNLIDMAGTTVTGYDATGTAKFAYTGPAGYALDGGAVAPLTYGPCPGCIFITATLASNIDNPPPSGNGAIFYVLPGTPSGSAVTLWSLTPGPEPEDIQFVPTNRSCTMTGPDGVGYDYFVASYAAPDQIDTTSTDGAILAFTPDQLKPFTGQLLVPDETGIISAFSAPGVFTTYTTTADQLEGSALLQCTSTGCPATFGYWKHHAFPSSMFSGGTTSIGCVNYSSAALLAILNQNNGGGNAVTILGHQLIAAIANYDAGGAQTTAATTAIGSAISLLCANNINMSTSFVGSGTPLGQQMTALSVTLDAYNSSASGCEGNGLAARATKKQTGKS